MKITILTIGKKHEAWIKPGVFRFLERLRAPFAAEILSHIQIMKVIEHATASQSGFYQESNLMIF